MPPPRRPRASRPLAAALTAMVMAGVLAALVYGFAPGLPRQIAQAALRAVAFTAPPAPKPPPPAPAKTAAGASGAAGRKAVARPVTASQSLTKPITAPLAAATGNAETSGARAAGAGSGAAGPGQGPGSGAGGYGAGAGTKAVKLSGEIEERDYPKAGRAVRLGHSVTVVLSVGADGRVNACRVHSPGPDPEADAITCRLAQQRFRFKPATDAFGNPVPSQVGWRQNWFY